MSPSPSLPWLAGAMHSTAGVRVYLGRARVVGVSRRNDSRSRLSGSSGARAVGDRVATVGPVASKAMHGSAECSFRPRRVAAVVIGGANSRGGCSQIAVRLVVVVIVGDACVGGSAASER